MEDKDLVNARSKLIVKHKDIIQKSHFDLSLLQQKVVLYLISQIQPHDEEFKVYEFSIGEFCKVCGIDGYSGKNYSMIKAAIKEIADKSMWATIPDSNGNQTLVRWIEKPYINENSGTIRIRLDEDMKPFLLQLKGNFTQYKLCWVLQFKRKYSTRLYELIKSVHYDELEAYEKVYELTELKARMGAETYTTWQTFKVRALEPAIAEINEYSDKSIEYETITYGKVVARIKLKISSKCMSEALRLRVLQEQRLGTDFTHDSHDIAPKKIIDRIIACEGADGAVEG